MGISFAFARRAMGLLAAAIFAAAWIWPPASSAQLACGGSYGISKIIKKPVDYAVFFEGSKTCNFPATIEYGQVFLKNATSTVAIGNPIPAGSIATGKSEGYVIVPSGSYVVSFEYDLQSIPNAPWTLAPLGCLGVGTLFLSCTLNTAYDVGTEALAAQQDSSSGEQPGQMISVSETAG